MRVLTTVLVVFGILGVMLIGLINLINPHEQASGATLALFAGAATSAIAGAALVPGPRRILSAALLALGGAPVVVWVFLSVREPLFPYDWKAALSFSALPFLLVVAALIRFFRR
jgi:hypothetical protein